MATQWRTVQCTEKPSETDTTSSPTTVYQRRNFKQTTIPAMMGEDSEPTPVWEYEERQMTVSEWENLNSLATQAVMQSISDLQVEIMMNSLGV